MSGNNSRRGAGDDQGPLHPSACLSCVCLGGHTVGGPCTIPLYTIRYGRISSISVAHDATQFGDSICLICISTFHMLVHSDPTDVGLN
jgi:hypothetical protein